jgi:hypothetical protein
MLAGEAAGTGIAQDWVAVAESFCERAALLKTRCWLARGKGLHQLAVKLKPKFL